MKNIQLFLCLMLLFGCKTSENKIWNTKKFVPLEKSVILNFMNDYSFEIPNNWYSYLGYHSIYHSPKRFMDNGLESQKVTIGVFVIKNVESKIDFFENEIKTNNITVNTNFEKVIVENTKYGDALLLKYGSIWNSRNNTNLFLYYYHKSKIYKLHFKASNILYKDVVDEAIKIMDSFKIEE